MEKLWRCDGGMLEACLPPLLHHLCRLHRNSGAIGALLGQAIPIFSPRRLHNFSTSSLYTKNGDFNGRCKSQPNVV